MSRQPMMADRAVAVKTAPASMPAIAEDDWIDKENVGHGDEGRQSGQAFALYRGVIFRQVKEPF